MCAKAQTTFVVPDAKFFDAILQPGAAINGNNIVVDCSTAVVSYSKRIIDKNILDSLKIVFLDVHADSIRNLQGIEEFIYLEKLLCSDNQLTSLPTLPTSLVALKCANNPICCCPYLPPNLAAFDYSNTNISCFPNYNAYINASSGVDICGFGKGLNTPCLLLNTAGMSESFPATGMRKIVNNATLDLPFTTTIIDTVAYELCVFQGNSSQNDTLAIFGGDIILGTPTQLAALYTVYEDVNFPIWQGKVPYDTTDISDSIKKAIAYFNVRAGLRGLKIAFVPKERGEREDIDYIVFEDSPNAYASSIGKRGGKQIIYVDYNGFTGKILHEMTHALGLYHEHQRAIAPNYITPNTNYILAEFADAFCQVNDAQTTPYDYNSIMHYVCYAFSSMPPLDDINLAHSYNTITPVSGSSFNGEMGQRADYTDCDITDINALYLDGITGGIGGVERIEGMGEIGEKGKGMGIYTLHLPSYQGQIDTVSWSIYDTEALLYSANNYHIEIVQSPLNGNQYQALVYAPQPDTMLRAARGFVVATVKLSNGTRKSYYKYVYRN